MLKWRISGEFAYSDGHVLAKNEGSAIRKFKKEMFRYIRSHKHLTSITIKPVEERLSKQELNNLPLV